MLRVRNAVLTVLAMVLIASVTSVRAPKASAETAQAWKIYSEMLGCMGDCNGPSGDPDCNCSTQPPIIVEG